MKRFTTLLNVAACFLAVASAQAQSCALEVVDSLPICNNALLPTSWSALGLDVGTWTSVSYAGPSGQNDSVSTSVALPLTDSGWWSFELYGASGDTCYDSLFVEVLAAPIPSFSATDGVCGNEGVSFTNTSTGGVGTIYFWDFGDGSAGSAATSPTHLYTLAGGGTTGLDVVLTAMNGDSTCSISTTETISVLQIPTPNFNDAPPLCQSDLNWPNYTLVLPPYPLAVSWHLDWGNGTDTTFTAPSFASPPATTYDSFGTFSIALTVVGVNGCSNVIVQEVFVGSNPTIGTANPGNTVGLCGPVDLVFPITDFVNNVDGTVYTIEFGDGATALYDHPPPSAVSHTYWNNTCGMITPEGSNNAMRFKVTASNECGTSISTHDPIRLHGTPDPQILGPTAVCPGTYEYDVIGNGVEVGPVNCSPSDVYWDVQTLSGSGSASANPGYGNWSEVNFSQPGFYEISVYDYHLYCEDGQDTLQVCVIPPPLASASPSATSGCAPFQVDFSSTTLEPAACGSYAYSWSVSGGVYGYAGGSTANSVSPTIVFYNEGQYTVTQTVTAPGLSCPSSTATYTINVYTLPTIDISSGGISCENEWWNVEVLSYDNGNDPGASFYWIIEGEDVFAPIYQEQNIYLDDPGMWHVYAFYTNACGTASEHVVMVVNDTPELNLIAPSSACAGTEQTIEVSGADNYSWSPPPSTLLPGNDAAIYSPTASQVVTVTGTYYYPSMACSSSSTVELVVDPLPQLVLNEPGSVCVGSAWEPQASVYSGTPGFLWGWTYGAASSSAEEPSFIAESGVGEVAVWVTDAQGCEDSAFAEITVLDLPVVEAGALDGFCDQSVDTLLSSGYPVGGVWSGTGISPSGWFNPVDLGVGSWLATYTYTDVNGCSNSDELTIEVFAPVFASAGEDVSFCNSGDSIQFDGFFPETQGLWTGPGIVSAGDGVVDLSALAPGNHIYTYSYGTGTCATSDELVLTVQENPTVTLSASDLTVCDGSVAYVSAAASGGAGGYTLELGGMGWALSTSTSATTTVSLGNTEPIAASVVDANGCVGVDTLEIEVLELPTILPTDTLVACNQAIEEWLPSPSPAGGSWSGPGVVTPTGSFNPALAGLGEIQLTYTYSDPFGCISSLSTFAEVIAPPVVVTGPAVVVCDVDTNVVLTGFDPSGGSWSGPGVSEDGIWSVDALLPGEYQAIYAFGQGSCAVSEGQNLTVLARPEVTLSGPIESCWGDSVTFTVDVVGTPPFLIEWLSPAAPSGPSANFLPSAVGPFVVNVLVTDANGCAEFASLTTTVHGLPMVDAGSDVLLCEQPIAEQLVGASPIPGTYSGTPAVSSSGWFDPSVSGLGMHEVLYTHVDPVTGCSQTDTLVVEVVVPVFADAGPDLEACLNAGSLNLQGATSGTWSGSIGLTDVALGTVDPLAAGVGVHAFVLSYGGASCLTTDTMVLEVLPLPVLTLEAASVFCLNDSVVLLPEALPLGGDWSGLGLVGGSDPQAFDALVGVGVYDLAYSYEDSTTGCATQIPHQVTVLGLPVVDAGLDVLLCNQPIDEILTGSSPSTGPSNVYYGLGGASSAVTSAGVFSPSISGTGDFAVVYAHADPTTGCVGRDTLMVTVVDPQIAEAGFDTIACANAPAIELEGFAPATGGTWFSSTLDDAAAVLNASAGIIDPQQLAVGDHWFYYAYGTGTCYTKDSLVIEIDPLPVIDVNGDDTFCLNDTLMPLASVDPVGGTWFGTGVQGNDFNTLVGPGGFDVNYWYESPITGCRDTAEHHVTVQPLPLVFAGQNLTLCNQPIPHTLTGYAPLTNSGGTGMFYGVGALAAAATASSGVFDPSISGVGSFQIVYAYTSNITGCTNRDTLTINVVAPIIANAGLDTLACANAPLLQLDGFLPLNGGQWSGIGAADAAVVSSSSGLLDPQALAPGTHSFYIEIGTGTCYSSDTLTVVIDPLPTMALGDPDTYCLNDTLMPLTWATPAGGTWEGPGVDGLNFETLIGPGSYDLIYWYESPVTGCRDTLEHEVLVQALPMVNAGLDLVLCDQPIGEQLVGFSPPLNASGTGMFYGIGPAAAATSSTGWFEPNVTGVGTYEVVYAFVSSVTQCGHTDTLSVIVNPPVVAEAGLDTLVCANAPLVELEGYVPTSNVFWYSEDPVANAAVVSTASGSIHPQLLPVGTHAFFIEYGSGTCYSKDSMELTVLPLPQLTLGDANAWCGNLGEQVLSLALPAAGSWFGTGILDAQTGAFNSEIPAGSYAPGFTYTEATTGCADTVFHDVTIHPVPVAAFDADSLGCTNAPFQMDQQTTGANAAFWWFGDGDVSYAWEPSHLYDAPGWFTVTMMATSNMGCQDTTVLTIEITTPPQAYVELDPGAGCAPLEVNFTNNSVAPYGSYSWEIGTFTTNVEVPSPMTFNQSDSLLVIPVELTASNACGTDLFSDEILVYPAPNLSFIILQDTACSPFELEFLNTSVGLPETLTWDFGNGAVYSGLQPPATWYTVGEAAEDFVISLVGVNDCGTDSVQQVFHLLPNTVSAFFEASASSGCAPLEVEFTDLSQNATTITFDFGNGQVSFDSLSMTTFDDPGTFEIQQFATNGCGYDTIAMEVEVFAEPSFSLTTATNSYCVNEPVNFLVEATTSGTADWSFGNGLTGQGYFVATSYDEPGIYWASAEVSTALFACTALDSLQVEIHPVPQWDLEATEPGCAPLEVTFINNSTNAQYVSWDFDDGTSPAVAWAPIHVFENQGNAPVTYEVHVVAQSADFCEADTVLSVAVLPNPQVNFALSSITSCELPVDLSVVDATTGAVSTMWWFDGEWVAVNGIPEVTVTTVGIHWLAMEATNLWGCTSIDSVQFEVLQQPLALLDAYPVVGCQILPVTFEDLSVGASSNHLQLFSPSGLVYEGPLNGSVLFDLEQEGTYTAYYSATSSDGCADELDVPQLIQVHPTPIANFDAVPAIGTPTDIDPLNDTWEFESTSIGASIFNWNFGDGYVAGGPTTTHVYADAGIYLVTLTAANTWGCMHQHQEAVLLENLLQVFVPNAFTPPSVQSISTGTGSRGLNDAFRPVFSDLELVAEYELTVVNRWGEVVFHSYDPEAYWVGDAIDNGTHYAQDDVYVWTLYYQPTYEDIGVSKVGHVTLIRD